MLEELRSEKNGLLQLNWRHHLSSSMNYEEHNVFVVHQLTSFATTVVSEAEQAVNQSGPGPPELSFENRFRGRDVPNRFLLILRHYPRWRLFDKAPPRR